MLLYLSVALFFPALSSCQCVYSLPAGPSSSKCAQFDLTLLAHFGPYNVTPSDEGGYQKYYLKVCDVITTDMPDVCVSKKPSPAYKYSNEGGCRILGDIMKGYAFPLDPLNISKGISIAYSGGEGGPDEYWPTAVIYDLHCDTSGFNRLPTVLYEWPEATFRVRWQTGYACPQIIDSKSCQPSTPPNGWDGVRFRNYPDWYNRAKFGILVTWGLFSVPAYGNESYWKNLESGDPDTVRYHNKVYGCSGIETDKFPCVGPKFTYEEFAPLFKAEHFDPDHWADIFQKAGAKYVVLTSKYRDGWCNFPSHSHKNWNSQDIGPHRDLIGNLTNSVRGKGLKMGFYHSLNEWYNPILEKDASNNCSTTNYSDKILLPTLQQIVNDYKPDLLLSDGIQCTKANCSKDSVKYLKSDVFLNWLYNKSPVKDTIVTNSLWGIKSFGSYYGDDPLADIASTPRYKWEFLYGIQNDSYGFNYKYRLTDVADSNYILWKLMEAISDNGNFLLNIGPMANGTIHPLFIEVLVDIGKWMSINGEAVYDTIPWNCPWADYWYTASVDWHTVYAVSFTLLIPGQSTQLVHIVTSSKSQIYLLETNGEVALPFKKNHDNSTEITMPKNSTLPKYTPFTIKMTYVTCGSQ